MLLREEKNPQPKLPEGVPTLLPPMHLAAVILTAVIHNVTLKHNSAQGKPPSHRQHRFVFFPGACHSPCWIACEKGEKNRACGRGKKWSYWQICIKASGCETNSLFTVPYRITRVGRVLWRSSSPTTPPRQGHSQQATQEPGGFWMSPERETPPTSLGSLYFQIQFFRRSQV